MKILFVCTGNAFRSPIAEALTKMYKPKITAFSAGIEPRMEISHVSIELLKKHDAIKYLKKNPERIDDKLLSNSDIVIAMENMHRDYILRNFKINPDNVIVWNITEAVNGLSFDDIFQKIKEKVLGLP